MEKVDGETTKIILRGTVLVNHQSDCFVLTVYKYIKVRTSEGSIVDAEKGYSHIVSEVQAGGDG